MRNKIIKLLGGYTKGEYNALYSDYQTAVDEKNKSLAGTIWEHKQAINKLEDTISDLEETVKKYNVSIHEMEDTIKQKDSDIDALNQKLQSGVQKFTICLDGGKVWIE